MPETVIVTVEGQMPLACALATRYSIGAEPNHQQLLDRLIEVARAGLVRAVERFDARAGPSFKIAAVPMIIAELRRDVRRFDAQQSA